MKSAARQAHDEARVRATEWYAVIDEDADLDYLLNTALPQAKEVTEDAKRSTDGRDGPRTDCRRYHEACRVRTLPHDLHEAA